MGELARSGAEDARYVQSLVRTVSARASGPLRIEAELEGAGRRHRPICET